MKIIEGIRDYIFQCPFLQDGKINVDYLGLDASEYSIDAVPANAVLKTFIDGCTLRQFVFTFRSAACYGPDVLQNIENSGFYEDFAAWLEEESRRGRLPKLPEGMQADKIEAMSTGYLFDNGPDSARYQIQCRLVYYQEKGGNEIEK